MARSRTSSLGGMPRSNKLFMNQFDHRLEVLGKEQGVERRVTNFVFFRQDN